MNRKAEIRSECCSDFFCICIILGCALGLRLAWLSVRGFGIFNSDQAIIGLMAKHILEGKPMVYFYGQGYMGSLEAFAAAFLFHFFGMKLSVLQCAPLIFHLGFLTVNFYLLKKIFGRGVSFTAQLLLAVSPPYLSILSVTSLGGYPETLFFGALTLLGYVHYEESKSKKILFLTGLSAGIGFWVNNLILMYFFAGALYFLLKSSFWEKHYTRKFVGDLFLYRVEGLPLGVRSIVIGIHLWMLIFCVWHTFSFFVGPKSFSIFGFVVTPASPIFHVKKMKGILLVLCMEGMVAFYFQRGIETFLKVAKSLIPLVSGFLMGASPAVLYTVLGGEGYRLIHGAGLIYFREIPAQVHEVVFEGLLSGVFSISIKALNNISSSFGIGTFLSLWASVFLLGCLPKTLRGEIKSFLKLEPKPYSRAIYPFILLAVNLIICLFCNLKSARYLMPLCFSSSLLFSLGAANLYSKNKLASIFSVLMLLLGYGYANYAAMQATPTRSALLRDYQESSERLQNKGICGGYADYWLSYEMTFMLQEKLIVAPYESEDRYPSYTSFANALEKPCYFFLNRQHKAEEFEKKLLRYNLSYEKEVLQELTFFIVQHQGPA